MTNKEDVEDVKNLLVDKVITDVKGCGENCIKLVLTGNLTLEIDIGRSKECNWIIWEKSGVGNV